MAANTYIPWKENPIIDKYNFLYLYFIFFYVYIHTLARKYTLRIRMVSKNIHQSSTYRKQDLNFILTFSLSGKNSNTMNPDTYLHNKVDVMVILVFMFTLFKV